MATMDRGAWKAIVHGAIKESDTSEAIQHANKEKQNKTCINCVPILRRREKQWRVYQLELHPLCEGLAPPLTHTQCTQLPSLPMAADRWYKMQYVLSPVYILQKSTSSHGIYGSTVSLLRSKTEKINIIFVSIISGRLCCHSGTVMLTLCDPMDCRLPCISLYPRVCLNSCPLSQ